MKRVPRSRNASLLGLGGNPFEETGGGGSFHSQIEGGTANEAAIFLVGHDAHFKGGQGLQFPIIDSNSFLGSLLLDGGQTFFQIGKNRGPKSLDLIFFQNATHGGAGQPLPVSIQVGNPEIGQRFLGQRLGQIPLERGRRG